MLMRGAGEDAVAVRSRPWQRHPRAWRVAKWAVGLILLAVAGRVIAGSFGDLRTAVDSLRHLRPGYVVLAVAAEVLSYVTYAGAQKTLLASAGHRVKLLPLTGITVAGQAASNVLPGGLAVSSVVMYRQLRRRQVPDVVTGWMLVLVSLLYGTALGLLALIGVFIVGDDNPIPGLRVFSLGVVGVLLAGLIALSMLRTRLPALARRSTTLRAWLHRLREVHVGAPAIVAALLLVADSWLADGLALVAAFGAVGTHPPWHGMLLAFAAGMMAASLPITPGGLGIAEGSLTVVLVAFGGAKTATLAAVLLYRLVAYWGLLPAGGVAYLLLRRHNVLSRNEPAPPRQPADV